MEKKGVIIGVSAIAVVVLLGAIFFMRSSRVPKRDSGNGQAVVGEEHKDEGADEEKLGYTPNPELEAGYESAMHDLLQRFDEGMSIAEVHEQLLKTIVPDRYTSLHLDLVVIFDSLLKGSELADQAKIESALERLNEVKVEYPFL